MKDKLFLKSAAEAAEIAIMTAVLICGQVALAGVGGVEIVTVLLLTYSCSFGARRGVAVAMCFAVLRNLIFGFRITAILLYLIYYPLFALFWGTAGARIKNLWLTVIAAAICTLLFTCIDNLITPFVYFCIPSQNWNFKATVLYWYYSVPFAAVQTLCTIITVTLAYKPLTKVFKIIRKGLAR